MENKKKLKFKVTAFKDQFPIYLKAVDAVRGDKILKFKRLLQSNELSYAEKRILQARLCVHNQEWHEALKILKTFKSDYHPFLVGEIHFLASFCYQMLRDQNHVLEHLENALEAYLTIEHGRGVFSIYYNIAVFYERQSLLEEAIKYYELAFQWSHSKEEELYLYKGMAYIFLQQGEKEKAFSNTIEFMKIAESLPIKEKAPALSCAYDIFFQLGRIEEAKEMNEACLKMRSNPMYVEVILDKILLEFLETKILVRNPPKALMTSIHSHKFNLIEALEIADLARAKREWELLKKDSPFMFGEFLNLKSSSYKKTIFGTCLKIFDSFKNANPSVDFKEMNLPKRPSDRLVYLLENSAVPLLKEDLIEVIWECEYSPELNSKFYKLVKRVKASHQIVKTRQGYKKLPDDHGD